MGGIINVGAGRPISLGLGLGLKKYKTMRTTLKICVQSWFRMVMMLSACQSASWKFVVYTHGVQT